MPLHIWSHCLVQIYALLLNCYWVVQNCYHNRNSLGKQNTELTWSSSERFRMTNKSVQEERPPQIGGGGQFRSDNRRERHWTCWVFCKMLRHKRLSLCLNRKLCFDVWHVPFFVIKTKKTWKKQRKKVELHFCATFQRLPSGKRLLLA